MLLSTGSRRVGRDRVTEQQWQPGLWHLQLLRLIRKPGATLTFWGAAPALVSSCTHILTFPSLPRLCLSGNCISQDPQSTALRVALGSGRYSCDTPGRIQVFSLTLCPRWAAPLAQLCPLGPLGMPPAPGSDPSHPSSPAPSPAGHGRFWLLGISASLHCVLGLLSSFSFCMNPPSPTPPPSFEWPRLVSGFLAGRN